jgi:hypothetical protein
MRLRAQNVLAIGVDYQERLIPAINDKESLLRDSRILLSGLDLLEIPMILSRQYPKGLGDTVSEIRKVTAKATVMDKTTFSCYQNVAIKREVDATGRRQIVLCGVEAHVCVLQTAIDLREAGFQVALVADCLGSRRPGDKKYALKRAVAEGALLVSYEQLLFELLAGASSPAFKSLSALLK